MDKEGNREVTYEKAENFAKKNGILFREINCINGNGIEEAFNDLVMEILYEDGLASPLRAIMLKKQKVEKKEEMYLINAVEIILTTYYNYLIVLTT